MTIKIMKISELQPLDFPREDAQRKLKEKGNSKLPEVYFDGERNLVCDGNNEIYRKNKEGYQFIFVDYKKPILRHHLDESIIVANHFQRQGISSFDDLTEEKIKNFRW